MSTRDLLSVYPALNVVQQPTREYSQLEAQRPCHVELTLFRRLGWPETILRLKLCSIRFYELEQDLADVLLSRLLDRIYHMLG
jgi:hypothetical protein